MGLVGRKGKLTITRTDTDIREVAWQRYEDVLTADVFGAYRYLPPTVGLLPLLHRAFDETGQTLSHFLRRCGIEPSSLDIARIRFWPTFKNGREPDVFVLLKSTQHERSVALLVEAKLHAPQHEIGEHSQLGHYLLQHLADAYADASLAWELPERPRPLLFITDHNEIPTPELARARAEVCREEPSLSSRDVGIFWTNWATVGLEARRLWREHRDEVDSAPWLRHLLDLYEEIRDRDLLPRPQFEGITAPHCSKLPQLYRRSYLQPVLSSLCPTHIARRRYFDSSVTRALQDSPRYCRTYDSLQLEWNRTLEIYCREGMENT